MYTVIPANKDRPFCQAKVSYKAGGLIRQVQYNVKQLFQIFLSGLKSQVVSRRGGLIKQGPLYI